MPHHHITCSDALVTEPLYSPPSRVRQAGSERPPIEASDSRALAAAELPLTAHGVAVTGASEAAHVASTAHPVAIAALATAALQTLELTERPDGTTQLVLVMRRDQEQEQQLGHGRAHLHGLAMASSASAENEHARVQS